MVAYGSNMYLRDGSDHTQRYKSQIKLPISTHSILTTGQPVPALTLERHAPGRETSGIPTFKSLV